jgi:hypothetical protein
VENEGGWLGSIYLGRWLETTGERAGTIKANGGVLYPGFSVQEKSCPWNGNRVMPMI